MQKDAASQALTGLSIAIMVASGFEETEMTEPQRALLKEGGAPKIVSPDQGLVNGWHGKAWGHFFPVDKQIGSVLGADFDMLLIPGGERSIAKLSDNPHGKRIVSHFLDAGKPVAAIGCGVSMLAIAGKVKGRAVAAADDLRPAIEAAGGTVSDEPVVVDGLLVTACDSEALATFVAETSRVFVEAAQIRKAA